MVYLVKYVDMFSGEGPEIGIFTIKNSEVSLEILPPAYEMAKKGDFLILTMLESMQKKIKTESLLMELIETSSSYSSLQFYRL